MPPQQAFVYITITRVSPAEPCTLLVKKDKKEKREEEEKHVP